ncbi:MAG: 8-oxo-dGTP diphosphatase [Clostridiales bacterium]|nr:8-oxo-dGTP diphosphatase [Clostridiales bacterium]
MPKIKIVNMVMIYNKSTRKAVVLDRISGWPGLTFPGGHVEFGESFYDSAVREAREETGLDVKNLKSCGVVHWANRQSGERYIEFLYKTSDFSGILIDGTVEGKVFWLDIDKLCASDKLSPNFALYLPMFLDDKYSEMFFEWDGKAWTGVPNYK